MMWAWDEWWASTDTGSDLRRVLSLSLRRDMTMKPKSEPETISSSLLMSLRREFRLKLHQETGPRSSFWTRTSSSTPAIKFSWMSSNELEQSEEEPSSTNFRFWNKILCLNNIIWWQSMSTCGGPNLEFDPYRNLQTGAIYSAWYIIVAAESNSYNIADYFVTVGLGVCILRHPVFWELIGTPDAGRVGARRKRCTRNYRCIE